MSMNTLGRPPLDLITLGRLPLQPPRKFGVPDIMGMQRSQKEVPPSDVDTTLSEDEVQL